MKDIIVGTLIVVLLLWGVPSCEKAMEKSRIKAQQNSKLISGNTYCINGDLKFKVIYIKHTTHIAATVYNNIGKRVAINPNVLKNCGE